MTESSKVAPLKLTEEERLRFENYTLKLRVIQHEAAKQAAVVVSKRMELAKEIGKRLGISMEGYTVNIKTGEVSLVEDSSQRTSQKHKKDQVIS